MFLITGAAGFVGANLCRRLAQAGEEVHALVKPTTSLWRLEAIRDRLHIHTADVCDGEQINRLVEIIQPTIVYHLATHGAYHYQTAIQKILLVNVLGLWNLLNACNRVGYELFVNTGSSSEYGRKPIAMRETDLLSPNSFYAVAKSAQSLLCQYSAQASDHAIVTLRLFSVYGPYEESTRLIPQLMMAALNHACLDMVAPETARDFVYVDDVVDVYLGIEKLRPLRGEILNVGTGVQTSLAQVVSALEESSGIKLDVRWNSMPPRLWDTDVWVADVSKLRRLTGYCPQTSLREGLTRCLLWFRQHQPLYPR